MLCFCSLLDIFLLFTFSVPQNFLNILHFLSLTLIVCAIVDCIVILYLQETFRDSDLGNLDFRIIETESGSCSCLLMCTVHLLRLEFEYQISCIMKSFSHFGRLKYDKKIIYYFCQKHKKMPMITYVHISMTYNTQEGKPHTLGWVL